MNRKGKIAGLLLLLFCFALFFLAGLGETHMVRISVTPSEDSDLSILARLSCEDTSVSIEAYHAEDGAYYLFLPSWAEGRFLRVNNMPFRISFLTSGLSIPLDSGQTLTILTGSEIPSVFLTLENDLSYISSDQELSDSGQAVILDADGSTSYNGTLKKIRGRGNTSWEQDKKPYNITLEDAVSLPGTNGAASADYSLISSSDTTFLRNRISNEMAEAAGSTALPCIRINLYINNSFEGVYELSLRISPDSLGISDLEEDTEQANPLQNEETLRQLTTGQTLDDWNQSVTGKWWNYENDPESITGGYILEADNAMRYGQEASGFTLESGAYIVSKSPEYLSEKQYQYISSYVQECENAMQASVGLDNYDLLSTYIDIPSFVGKYLVEEISKNIDCSSTSQYFYKDQDGVLHAGPAWDYDWAYGVERLQEGIDYMDPEGFSARDIPGTLIWWQLLYYNNAFYEDVVTVYEDILYPWLNELVQTGLTEWADELSDSAVMDYLRWERTDENAGDENISGETAAAVTESGVSSSFAKGFSSASSDSAVASARKAYLQEVEKVRSFLDTRKEFLYEEWVG